MEIRKYRRKYGNTDGNAGILARVLEFYLLLVRWVFLFLYAANKACQEVSGDLVAEEATAYAGGHL